MFFFQIFCENLQQVFNVLIWFVDNFCMQTVKDKNTNFVVFHYKYISCENSFK